MRKIDIEPLPRDRFKPRRYHYRSGGWYLRQGGYCLVAALLVLLAWRLWG